MVESSRPGKVRKLKALIGSSEWSYLFAVIALAHLLILAMQFCLLASYLHVGIEVDLWLHFVAELGEDTRGSACIY